MSVILIQIIFTLEVACPIAPTIYICPTITKQLFVGVIGVIGVIGVVGVVAVVAGVAMFSVSAIVFVTL